jgi:hypothetical protein
MGMIDMDISSVAILVAEHGVSIASAIVILYGVIRLINFAARLAEHKLLVSTVTRGSARDDPATTRIVISPPVHGALNHLRLRARADRAYIFEFHSKCNSLGGLPFLHMSCSYEALSEDASSQLNARLNMPFSLFDSLVNLLIKQDVVMIDTRERISEIDPIVYETIEKRGTVIVIGAKLLNEQRRPIGFAGLDFCEPPDIAIINVDTAFINADTAFITADTAAIEETKKIVFKETQILSALLYVKADEVIARVS